MNHLALNTSLNRTSSTREDTAGGSFKPLIAGLFQLLNGEHDTVARRLRNGDLLVDEFSRFVDRYRLQSVVLSLLQGSPLLGLFPGEWLQQLKVFSLNQWARQEILVRELGRISALLRASGHDFILLKGPYLATRFYGAIDRREFSDLDILVKREQVGAVELLLRGAGYARKSRVLFSTAVTSRFTHAFDFAKGNVSVDLHWLLSANAAHYLDYEAIWRQRQNFILRGQDFLVLSDEHEIAFKLISIFKDLEISAIHLKSFVDLYFILSAVSPGLDWKEFLEHRRREKILRISVNVLAFFFELFNCRHRFPDVASGKVRARPPVKQVNIP